MNNLEKIFKSIDIDINYHSYYKTVNEVFNELARKWRSIPEDKQNNFKEEVKNYFLKKMEGQNEIYCK